MNEQVIRLLSACGSLRGAEEARPAGGAAPRRAERGTACHGAAPRASPERAKHHALYSNLKNTRK